MISDPQEFTDETDVSGEATVVTVEGGRADLPCDIEAKSQDDSVYLVLWYRKNSGTPIYRFVPPTFAILHVPPNVLQISAILGTFSLLFKETRESIFAVSHKILFPKF